VPQVREEAVVELLEEIERDHDGRMAFHDVQKAIAKVCAL
jgi:Ca2+-binding EF-hand superfamily protein